ncbi:hypothetical protein PVAP13_6NG202312 [Panicum virgatum]|uniref:Uncharacterized protein n=1 Tax=Panicum virgatum TaxID=38727 RepID=A0A8T0QZC2_PANVG|nr:hypothetical protein PVAP13_6NG202312 [Panicum virgatum]
MAMNTLAKPFLHPRRCSAYRPCRTHARACATLVLPSEHVQTRPSPLAMPPRRVLSLPSPLHCRWPKASPWPWPCPTGLADEPLFQAGVPCLAITPSLPCHLEHALALPPSHSPYRRTARHRPVPACNPAMSRSGLVGAPRSPRPCHDLDQAKGT